MRSDSTLDARDPVKTHLRLQEALRYVFQANRAIEDFLGDDKRIAGGEAPPDAGDPGGEFYFATAARRYLAAVEPAFGSLKDAAVARCNTVAAMPPGWLTPALRVAGGRESTNGRPLLVDLRPKQLALELEIRPGFPAAVPAGTAALAVWHGSRPLKLRRAGAPASDPPVTAIPLPVGDAAAPVDLEVLLPDMASDAVELRVIVFYRNHASEQKLDLRPARQSQVARWERPRPRDATVIVERDVKDPGTACFILDCSASMETDLKTALAAATRVLSDLSDYHPRLSVWLFGHRIHHRQWRTWNSRAFARTPEGRLVDQLKKPQGENVDISTDIAMVWKSGDPFGFREVLDPERVKPFGHTPLHLAMIRAMHEELESGAEPRRLVVLTDGADSIDVFRYANERFDANDPAYRKDMDGRLTLKAPEDVQRAWEDMPGRDRPQVFFLVAATTKDSEMTALRKLSDLVQGEVALDQPGGDRSGQAGSRDEPGVRQSALESHPARFFRRGGPETDQRTTIGRRSRQV